MWAHKLFYLSYGLHNICTYMAHIAICFIKETSIPPEEEEEEEVGTQISRGCRLKNKFLCFFFFYYRIINNAY